MKHHLFQYIRKGSILLLLPALLPGTALCSPAPSPISVSLPETDSKTIARESGRDERDEQIAKLTQQVETLIRTVEILKESVETLKESVEALERGAGAQPYAGGTEGAATGVWKSAVGTPSAGEEDIPDNALVAAPATYPGGAAALLRSVSENLRYPEAAFRDKVQGTIVLRFVVQKDGTVGKVQVTKSLTPETDREATRLVKSLKKFHPARQDGQPVAVWFTLPILFQIR